MGTVETGSSKTLAPSSEKTLMGALDSESGKHENGDKDLGEPEISGKEGSLNVEKDGLVEAKHGVEVGKVGEKDGLEENGVSLNENGNGPSGKAEASVGGVNESEDVQLEDLDGEGDKFCVGDFVWGKIKSHPWWPGQIYDPSYASDYALKIKSKGRNLVAYFGDGTFAWCQPSQLKPFEENYEEMLKQSSMKTFVSAVQEAVDEIGRVLELKMVCSCVPKENRTGLDQLVAENAGIKQGTLVPEGEIRKFTDVLIEPSELLSELKRVTQAVYVTNALELRVLKSRLSAFYRAKGGYELPQYHDPNPIHGLDDGEKSIEAPTQGPFEDWLPMAIDVSTVQTDESWLRSNPVISESRKTPKKKERSIADLIGIKETNLEKLAPSSGAKRRKSRGELDHHDEISLTSPKGKRKRAGISNDSSAKKDESRAKEKTKEGSASKGRPKQNAAMDFENDDGESKNEAGGGSGSGNLKSENRSLKSDDGVDKEQFEKSSSVREKKKSKYLSPPFTNVSSKRRRDAENEVKVSFEDTAGEEVDISRDQNIVSPQLLKCSSSEMLPKKVSTEPGLVDETSHGSSPVLKAPTQNQDNIVDPSKTSVPANEFLSKVRSAAANPRGKKPLDMVSDFMSVFRNSVYLNGSNYKLYNKPRSRRKRKTLDSVSGSQVEDPKQPAEKSPKNKPNSGVSKEKEKRAVETLDGKSSGRRKSKQETATPEIKKKKKEKTLDKKTVEETNSPAYLFATFGLGSALPTKADLIRIYSKYGKLDEKETDMFYDNFFARVCFVKSSDADVAYNDSKEDCPFVSADVSFRLQYHSGEYKSPELSNISSQSNVKTRKKPSKLPANGSGQSDLGFVKQKLEMISSMLEDTEGEVTPTIKSKLQKEIKGLSKKVSAMVGSSS
ncbi:Serine/threonine-protein kinase ATM [Morus notabilis]|uniref:Serine/threonine-protein kinase ATM n=2 Tax=Morus notabilis TaxID=981085 RepID=W9S0P5_9ROSA|nr:uncharacterized protein LOC21403412 isoform X2 [Morus notabilis]EXC20299.1 Serine/threonine-protein kinase ATM [Morus notabilis]